MAHSSLSKSHSKLNLNSRRHIQLYQKVLFVGSQMAGMLHDLNRQSPLPKAVMERADEWIKIMDQLTEVLL